MENKEQCITEVAEQYWVVEFVNTLNIDNYWFKHKNQYPYVRTEFMECEPRFQIGTSHCDHHIVYIESQKREIAVPEHIGILTNEIRSEISQNTLTYLREKYNDKITDRWKFYTNYTPIDPSEKHRATVQHANAHKLEEFKERKGK